MDGVLQEDMPSFKQTFLLDNPFDMTVDEKWCQASKQIYSLEESYSIMHNKISTWLVDECLASLHLVGLDC